MTHSTGKGEVAAKCAGTTVGKKGRGDEVGDVEKGREREE